MLTAQWAQEGLEVGPPEVSGGSQTGEQTFAGSLVEVALTHVLLYWSIFADHLKNVLTT